MLMYRQVASEGNAKFLELCDVPDHIAELICKLKNEEEMERRRKEMDRCMCKVQFPLLYSLKLDPDDRALHRALQNLGEERDCSQSSSHLSATGLSSVHV